MKQIDKDILVNLMKEAGVTRQDIEGDELVAVHIPEDSPVLLVFTDISRHPKYDPDWHQPDYIIVVRPEYELPSADSFWESIAKELDAEVR